nr:ribonuclease P protein component [Actinopolymorpha rutila]
MTAEVVQVTLDVVVPARHRMRRPADFATAIRRGRRSGRSTLVVHLALTTDPAPARVGFVVSRAVGNAVVRNTVRRRLRHLLRDRVAGLSPGTLLVVRALPSAAEASSQRLGGDLDAALDVVLTRARRVEAEGVR